MSRQYESHHGKSYYIEKGVKGYSGAAETPEGTISITPRKTYGLAKIALKRIIEDSIERARRSDS